MQRTVDPERWFDWLEQQKAGLSPEHAAIVDVYIEHVRSERSQDVDRVMAHMTDDVIFQRFGVVGQMAEELDYRGIREMFAKAFDTGWPDFELETERFVVDDNVLVEDGVMWVVIEPAALALRTDVPEAVGDGKCLLTYRLAAFFEFRDGKICREDTYRGPSTVTAFAE